VISPSPSSPPPPNCPWSGEFAGGALQITSRSIVIDRGQSLQQRAVCSEVQKGFVHLYIGTRKRVESSARVTSAQAHDVGILIQSLPGGRQALETPPGRQKLFTNCWRTSRIIGDDAPSGVPICRCASGLIAKSRVPHEEFTRVDAEPSTPCPARRRARSSTASSTCGLCS